MKGKCATEPDDAELLGAEAPRSNQSAILRYFVTQQEKLPNPAFTLAAVLPLQHPQLLHSICGNKSTEQQQMSKE